MSNTIDIQSYWLKEINNPPPPLPHFVALAHDPVVECGAALQIIWTIVFAACRPALSYRDHLENTAERSSGGPLHTADVSATISDCRSLFVPCRCSFLICELFISY